MSLLETRPFGRLGVVSSISMGGGGIGRVYGHVDRAEALATVRAAHDAGVTLFDLAPTYGPGEAAPEAEELVAEAFGGRIGDDVLVTSKVLLQEELSRAEVLTK